MVSDFHNDECMQTLYASENCNSRVKSRHSNGLAGLTGN